MPKLSKRFSALQDKVEKKEYTVEEAVALAQECANAKFDETVEFAMKLGVDPRQSDQMVRGSVVLPHGTGKKIRVLVFANPPHDKEALDAGAEYAGLDEYVEKVIKGWLDFDVIVAMPDTMKEVGKLGKVLGPRGLMPSPKVGTVTQDVVKAVKEVKAGKVEFKVDKTANIHVPVGKSTFKNDALVNNIIALVEAVMKAKPTISKGEYFLSGCISSTMGPGIRLDLKDLKARMK